MTLTYNSICKPKSMAEVILLIQDSEIQSYNKRVLRASESCNQTAYLKSNDRWHCATRSIFDYRNRSCYATVPGLFF